MVVDNNTLRSNNADPGNDLGTLSLVDYDTDCEKCIEWHQSDISIGSVYQEWAVVEESKSLNNTLNGIYNFVANCLFLFLNTYFT